MTSNPSPASGRSFLSLRSRRLRILGIVLLAALVGLSVYGGAVLMPAFRQSQQAARRALLDPYQSGISAEERARRIAEERQAKKAAVTQIAFLYAYWTTCGALTLAVLLVAWLDVRELMRVYAEQRRAIWTEPMERAGRRSRPHGNGAPGSAPNGSPGSSPKSAPQGSPEEPGR